MSSISELTSLEQTEHFSEIPDPNCLHYKLSLSVGLALDSQTGGLLFRSQLETAVPFPCTVMGDNPKISGVSVWPQDAAIQYMTSAHAPENSF